MELDGGGFDILVTDILDMNQNSIFGINQLGESTDRVDDLYAVDVNVSDEVIAGQVTTGGLRATDLDGSGNAFACVDGNGIFFRSDTAC
jgi:hypothetical protein